jgi:hypothetical protein
MVKQFTGLKHPIQNYPYRQPMDIVKPMIPYVTDKVVCDIGCGCGDVLFDIGNYAKSIHGIELSLKFKSELNRLNVDRKFIRWDDIFNNGLPKSDVYYLWISSDKNLNRSIINLIPKGSLLIDATTRLNMFSDFNDLELIEKIDYKFDESDLLGEGPVLVGGTSFPTYGTNTIRVYKKI